VTFWRKSDKEAKFDATNRTCLLKSPYRRCWPAAKNSFVWNGTFWFVLYWLCKKSDRDGSYVVDANDCSEIDGLQKTAACYVVWAGLTNFHL